MIFANDFKKKPDLLHTDFYANTGFYQP